MEKLPSETISDILLRLPFDSLSESRYVCKSWSNIITYDPYFVNKHVQQLQTQNKDLGFIFLMKNFELCYVEYNDVKVYKLTKVSGCPIKFTCTQRAIVGSCNGLICISNDISNNPSYVCNPFTRECIKLPKIRDSVHDLDPRPPMMVRGFGYDGSSNQYKAVRILFRDKLNQWPVHVYTLGKDTEWRSKGNAPFFLRWYNSSGVLVNGALHWLTELNGVGSSVDYYCRIVAFGLASEEFRVVPSPSCVTPCKVNYELVQLGGCLCVTHYCFDGSLEIWMMKDYMSKNSYWTKEYTIGGGGGFCTSYKPLALTKDGEVLLWRSGVVLLSYDPNTGGLKVIKDHGNVSRLEAVTHMKSCVSLKAICGNPMMIRRELGNQKKVENGKRKRLCTE